MEIKMSKNRLCIVTRRVFFVSVGRKSGMTRTIYAVNNALIDAVTI